MHPRRRDPCRGRGYICRVTTVRSNTVIPEALWRWFWDVDIASLSWDPWRGFIIGRLLRSGDWHAIQWLLTQVTSAELALWLTAHRGGGLAPQRLRYWQLVLNLPAGEVDAWIAKTKLESWGTRTRR